MKELAPGCYKADGAYSDGDQADDAYSDGYSDWDGYTPMEYTHTGYVQIELRKGIEAIAQAGVKSKPWPEQDRDWTNECKTALETGESYRRIVSEFQSSALEMARYIVLDQLDESPHGIQEFEGGIVGNTSPTAVCLSGSCRHAYC